MDEFVQMVEKFVKQEDIEEETVGNAIFMFLLKSTFTL